MMDRGTFLYRDFLSHLEYEPTPCQDRMLRELEEKNRFLEDCLMEMSEEVYK